MKYFACLSALLLAAAAMNARPAASQEIYQTLDLEYSTYLGGSGADQCGDFSGNGGGKCVAVDSALRAYIIGSTASNDFPTVDPYQASKSSGDTVFIAKIDSDGSSLIYATYLGTGTGQGIALDGALNAYLVGWTGAADFPTVNPYQATLAGGNEDAFVAKLDSSGSALLYSTYLGGPTGYSPYEHGHDIAVDNNGNAHVTGSTGSYAFPTVNPYQAAFAGAGDAFAAKLDASGSVLLFSTYLGGADSDESGRGIAVDSLGCVLVAGDTSSDDFPTVNAYQAAWASNDDAFLSRLNPSGSILLFSTYLGGSHHDGAKGVAVDIDGCAYLAGTTYSSDFPTANAYQATKAGGWDAFLAKFNPFGDNLVYSTYFGGSGDDGGAGLAVYLDQFPFLAGYTESTDLPTRHAYQSSFASQTGGDAFLAKFSCQAQRLLFSTYLGGSDDDFGGGVAVDFQGSAYLAGTTLSADYPVVNPYQAAPAGSSDVFLSKLIQPVLRPVYASGDYNGDGTSEAAVFRSQEGRWLIRGFTRFFFAQVGDLLAPGDYNGDGTSDFGLYRPADGLWAIRNITRVNYGSAGDQSVPADYDGDGTCNIALFRPATSLWAVRGALRDYLGLEGDLPVPGDYDGDGSAGVGIFRPSTGMWSVKYVTIAYFGAGNDKVVPGDFDSDGTWDIGVFRPGSGLWAIRNVTRVYLGDCEDMPMPADYSGAPGDEMGLFREGNGLWAISGVTRFSFGGAGDTPVTR